MARTNTTSRPDFVTDEHLTFLDKLRESGITNMMGAGRYIKEHFEVDKKTSHSILSYWMETFGKDDR